MARNLYLFSSIVILGVLFTSMPLYASDFTDLNDAADDFDDYKEETFDPFDISIVPSFSYTQKRATIAREGVCTPGGPLAPGLQTAAKKLGWLVEDKSRCPNGPRAIDIPQLDYLTKEGKLNIDVRVGLYKDFEFRLSVPYVVYSSSAIKRKAGVTSNLFNPSNEDVIEAAKAAFVPAKNPTTKEEHIKQFSQFGQFMGNRLFATPSDYVTYKRSGFADPTFGLHYGIFNDQRDDTKATLNVGFDYTAPLATIKKIDNDAVGEGLHKFTLSLAASRRFAWIEPYAGFAFVGAASAGSSPLSPRDLSGNSGQVIVFPPQTGILTLGTEFIPYEDLATSQRYAIDLRFVVKYQSIGRTYSPLLDQFGHNQCRNKTFDQLLPKFNNKGDLTNVDDVACAWLLASPANYSEPIYSDEQAAALAMKGGGGDQVKLSYNGVTTSEGFATLTSQLAVNIQPISYLAVHAFGSISLEMDHLISGDGLGIDHDGDGFIGLEGNIAKRERNPVYNQAFDAFGRRLRVSDSISFSTGIAVAMQF